MSQISQGSITHQKPGLVDLVWVGLYMILLISAFRIVEQGRFCHQMGVDFRGYYASAQIAREHGFGAVYDQELQREYQSSLFYRCPTPANEPPMYVTMPYLPVYVLLFLPFTGIDFTVSYFIWVLVQILLFSLAIVGFTKVMEGKPKTYRLIQWSISIPMIANLYLGQSNAWVVWVLGAFVINSMKNKKVRGGLYLSAALIKPHMLILLLPGLVLSRNWLILLGFLVGSVVILGLSVVLAGYQGMAAMIEINLQFAGPLIQTASGMMNFRSFALNLGTLSPAWTAWLVAGLGTFLITGLIMSLWYKPQLTGSTKTVWLIAITILGTFMVSWHAHFYMHLLLVTLFFYLDAIGVLSTRSRAAWLLVPPVLYLVGHAAAPAFERNIFGLGMLVLNIYLLFHLYRGRISDP